MVRQRFPTQLRSSTIVSIREEISDAIPSMLEEVQSGIISRTRQFQGSRQYPKQKSSGSNMKCCLCEAAGRNPSGHYIQACPFLPPNDKKYISRTRDILVDDEEFSPQEGDAGSRLVRMEAGPSSISVSRRIEIVPSPVLEAAVNGVPISVLLDLGAEANLAAKAVCDSFGAVIVLLSSVQ